MEIFQIIWTALTNENIELIKILSAPLSILESFILMLLVTGILNIGSTRKQRILYVAIISICSYFSKFIIPNPYNTYINILVIFISGIFIFKLNIFKGLLALILPFAITILMESILSNVYSNVFSINYYVGMNIPLHRVIGALLIYFMDYLVYLFIKYFKVNFNKLQILDNKKRLLLIFNILFAMILTGLQIYVTYFYSSVLPFPIVILSLIGLITYVTINLYTVFTVSKLETTSMNLEEAKLYNKTLEILQDNTRAFRHDFTNILLGMTGYMDNNDMEGLKKYHNQLLDDIKQVNNLTTLSPTLVNNPAIYNVLASKYHKADNLGIKINLEVFLDLNDLHMKIYEFTRILGILMDNAIEATSECKDKIINVSIRKNTKKHMQLLQIENTYKDKEINTDKIFEKGYSTKEGNTGLGLWEIRQILKKNNNLNLYTSKNETYFSQQLEIYY
ncbi:MAG: GHKL domain-containing protein [Clostridia bacterium]|nr:GHKL domain-containing protein [Clostridia bacterium]